MLTSALAAALTGAALGACPASIHVSLDASGYTVAGVTLPARGEGVYSGKAGAVVISGSRAAASTTLDGQPMRGTCQLAVDARTERCYFQLGGSRLSSTDVMRGGGWDRSYQDGTTTRIELGGGRPLPVPFALGR